MQNMRRLVEDFNNRVTLGLFAPSKFRKELGNLLKSLSDMGIMVHLRILASSKLGVQGEGQEIDGNVLVEEGVMPSDGEMANRERMPLMPSNCTCVFSYQVREDLETQNVLQDFVEIALPLLKRGIEQIYGQRIDGKFFVPRIDMTEQMNIERTIGGASQNSPVIMASLDLDNFKMFNDNYSEQTGDDAIRRVGICLTNECQKHDEVYFYKSHFRGDEFLVLICGKSSVGAMRILLGIQDSISEIRMEGVDIPFVSSCGMAVYPADEVLPICSLNPKPRVGTSWLGQEEKKERGRFDHYYFLVDQARKMKHGAPIGGTPIPKGGLYRYKYFVQREPCKYEPTKESLVVQLDGLPFLVAGCKQFSFFLSRSNLCDSDMYFEYIVHKLARVQSEQDLWPCFQEALVQLNITILPFAHGNWSIQSLENGKIPWTAAYALFVASFNQAFFYDDAFRKRFYQTYIDIVLQSHSKEDETAVISLEVGNASGKAIQFPASLEQGFREFAVRNTIPLALYTPEISTGRNIPKCSIAAQDLPQSGAISVRNVLSPVLLLVIGKELEIPAALEAAPSSVCYLDDRPTIGGGLPDPWQSNISKIVNYTTSNPNVRFLVFYGNIGNSAQTWKICDRSVPETIMDKCESFVERRLLERFAKQVKKVENCSSYEEIEAILPLFLAPELQVGINARRFLKGEPRIDEGCIKEKPIKPEADPEKERIYARAMPLQKFELKSTEGLALEDINKAYPAVIDMLRNLSPESLCEDQIGRKMHELKGFKLVLTKPVPPTVPLFFRKTESQSEFEDYYKKVFNKDEGIFGKRIHKYPSTLGKTFDQYTIQLDYVCEQIKKGVATRRAGMQVAAPFVDWGGSRRDLPLGLVDLAMLPRPRQGRNAWALHFFFNWRTVEAIVGFPFSAYASCRFAEEFTRDVQGRLGKEYSVDTGEVVYYAISLHMFDDLFERKVARRIVEQVTK